MLHISKPDDDFLTVEQDDSLHAHDSGSDFFDLINQGNPQSHTGATALQGIIWMHRNVHDGNLRRQRSQENHHADRGAATAVSVVRKQGLSFVVPHANRQDPGSLFQPGVAKPFE